MFYALIDAASLKKPTILNNFQHYKVMVKYEPQSPTSKYHYVFLLQLEENKNDEIITTIQQEMLFSWYAFFWSDSRLYIVFNSKKFTVYLPNGWESESYRAAQEFGKTQDIPEEYLDYKKILFSVLSWLRNKNKKF